LLDGNERVDAPPQLNLFVQKGTPLPSICPKLDPLALSAARAPLRVGYLGWLYLKGGYRSTGFTERRYNRGGR
jgi:hypothetical protein